MKIGRCTTQQKKQNRDHRRRRTAVELAQLGGGELLRGTSCPPGKLGMCPSLAEPDSGGFPKSNLHTLWQKAKRFCRTVRKWFSKNQKIHIQQNFTAIFSRFPSDFHTNLRKSEEWRKRFARHKERSVLYGSIAASTGNL